MNLDSMQKTMRAQKEMLDDMQRILNQCSDNVAEQEIVLSALRSEIISLKGGK